MQKYFQSNKKGPPKIDARNELDTEMDGENEEITIAACK
jgi:hypothetical protein